MCGLGQHHAGEGNEETCFAIAGNSLSSRLPRVLTHKVILLMGLGLCSNSVFKLSPVQITRGSPNRSQSRVSLMRNLGELLTLH